MAIDNLDYLTISMKGYEFNKALIEFDKKQTNIEDKIGIKFMGMIFTKMMEAYFDFEQGNVEIFSNLVIATNPDEIIINFCRDLINKSKSKEDWPSVIGEN